MGYSSGGPGCTRCRMAAADAAVAAIHAGCPSFSANPTSVALRDLAKGTDVLTSDEVQTIGRGLHSAARHPCDLLTAMLRPPPKKTFGKGYASDQATVKEWRRGPAAWFPRSGYVVDQKGQIYEPIPASSSTRLRNEALVAIDAGAHAAARYYKGDMGGWGNDPTPESYEMLSGRAVRPMEPTGTGPYAYMRWGPLANAFNQIADELQR